LDLQETVDAYQKWLELKTPPKDWELEWFQWDLRVVVPTKIEMRKARIDGSEPEGPNWSIGEDLPVPPSLVELDKDVFSMLCSATNTAPLGEALFEGLEELSQAYYDLNLHLLNEIGNSLIEKAQQVAEETELPLSFILLLVAHTIRKRGLWRGTLSIKAFSTEYLKDWDGERDKLIAAVDSLLDIRVKETNLAKEVMERSKGTDIYTALEQLREHIDDSHRRQRDYFANMWDSERPPRKTEFPVEAQKALVAFADSLAACGVTERGVSARIIDLFESAKSPLVDSQGGREGAIRSMRQNLKNWSGKTE